MTSLRLYKKEKLRSLSAINALFSSPSSAGGENFCVMAYPWRAIWRIDKSRSVSCARFMITVPKKRLHNAVDRVTMRRRLREAYRLNRSLLPECSNVDVAFVYVGKTMTTYSDAERSVKKIFSRISQTLCNSRKNEVEAE